MFYRVLIIFFLYYFGSETCQAQIRYLNISLDEAAIISEDENKPIMLMCYEEWCGHCEKMLNEVFMDSALIQFYNENYLFIKKEINGDEGKALVKNYKIASYPTFVILNQTQEVLYQFVGEFKAADFIQQGANALIFENQLPFLKNAFEQNPYDSVICFKYIQTLGKGRLQTQQVVNSYFENNKSAFEFSTGNWKILASGVSDIHSDIFQFIIDHKKEWATVTSEKRIDRKIYLTSAYNLQTSGTSNDTLQYFKHRTKALEFGQYKIDSLIFTLDLSVYEKNKQWKKYFFIATTGTEKFVWNDQNQLRRIADTFLQYGTDKQEIYIGAKIAMRSAEIIPDYAHYLLAAKLFLKAEDKSQAKIYAEIAKVEAMKKSMNLSEINLILKQCDD